MISVNTRQFSKAISAAGRAVASRNALPILGHVCVKAKGGKVTVSGTDMAVWITQEIPQDGLIPGNDMAFTAPFRLLNDLVAKIGTDTVTVDIDADGKTWVTAGKSRANILGMDPADFPLMPDVGDGDLSFSIPIPVLAKSLKQAMVGISEDGTRTVLCSVLLEARGGAVRVICTNTHLLPVIIAEGIEGSPKDGDCLLPGESATDLLGVLPDMGRAYIKVGIGQVQFLWETEGVATTFISRTTDGQFANWRRVMITGDMPMNIRVNRDDLASSLSRALLFAEGKECPPVTLKVNDGSMCVMTRSGSSGRYNDDVAVTVDSLAFDRFCFNLKYLMSIVGSIDGEIIEIGCQEAIKAFRFRVVGNDNYCCILMPQNVNDVGILDDPETTTQCLYAGVAELR